MFSTYFFSFSPPPSLSPVLRFFSSSPAGPYPLPTAPSELLSRSPPPSSSPPAFSPLLPPIPISGLPPLLLPASAGCGGAQPRSSGAWAADARWRAARDCRRAWPRRRLSCPNASPAFLPCFPTGSAAAVARGVRVAAAGAASSRRARRRRERRVRWRRERRDPARCRANRPL